MMEKYVNRSLKCELTNLKEENKSYGVLGFYRKKRKMAKLFLYFFNGDVNLY
uniref:Uncharacterized protein n=1 Tax=Nelumbo nucifera TaxID=4432 RepID=A0A822XPE5_NELNU|nr:TPA_asm: hypothetical protein HUJ06_023640 [Nelumbo nucifera]